MKHYPAYEALVSKTQVLKFLGICGLSLLSAGCVETAAQNNPPPQAPPNTNMVQREGVSPRGASVAIANVNGVSPSVSERLQAALEKQARPRDVNLTSLEKARYLVNGYVTASPAEDGAGFSVVWDVYNAKKHLIQRISDRVFVKGGTAVAEDIDDGSLNQIAAKSAADLAAVLSNMPEAIAAASSPAKMTSVAQASEGITQGTTQVGRTTSTAAASPGQPEKSFEASAALH